MPATLQGPDEHQSLANTHVLICHLYSNVSFFLQDGVNAHRYNSFVSTVWHVLDAIPSLHPRFILFCYKALRFCDSLRAQQNIQTTEGQQSMW